MSRSLCRVASPRAVEPNTATASDGTNPQISSASCRASSRRSTARLAVVSTRRRYRRGTTRRGAGVAAASIRKLTDACEPGRSPSDLCGRWRTTRVSGHRRPPSSVLPERCRRHGTIPERATRLPDGLPRRDNREHAWCRDFWMQRQVKRLGGLDRGDLEAEEIDNEIEPSRPSNGIAKADSTVAAHAPGRASAAVWSPMASTIRLATTRPTTSASP